MNLTTLSTSQVDISGSVEDSTISPISDAPPMLTGTVTLPFMSGLYKGVVSTVLVCEESVSCGDLNIGSTTVVATVTGEPVISLNSLAEFEVGDGSSSSELLPPSLLRFLVGAERSSALES